MEDLMQFFKWCLIWGGAMYLFTVVAAMCMPTFIYNVQSRFIKIDRPEFDLMLYGYIGVFKLLFIFFVVVPFLALWSMN